MHFSRFLLPILSLSAARVAGRPADITEQSSSREITSPDIIQSVDFEIDAAIDTREKLHASVDEILKNSKTAKESATETADKIRKSIADLIVCFTDTQWAVEGDLNDAIHIIGDTEAELLQSSTEKLVKLAESIASGSKHFSDKVDKDIVDLLRGEGEAIMTSLRAIFTPIENFVSTSRDSTATPGALKRAKADTRQAGKKLDRIAGEFHNKSRKEKAR